MARKQTPPQSFHRKGALFTLNKFQAASQTFGLQNYKIVNMSDFMTQMCGDLLK